MKIINTLLLTLFCLVLLIGASLYGMLRLSLPQYQGEFTAAVAHPVTLERDQLGYLTVRAADRADAAYGLGFGHAQERFFQMDLSRRNAAGELAELFGHVALSTDIERRQHRFRQRAELLLEQMPTAELAILSAYARGVNDGLDSLRLVPFEYSLLRQSPQPWQETDSILVLFSMYLDLQGKAGRDDYAMGLLQNAISPEWFAFLQQHSSDWQATIDNSLVKALPMPTSSYPKRLRLNGDCEECDPVDAVDLGSNNFAVSGSLSQHGAAIVANDMHLSQRVPGIWYKTQLNWRDSGQWRQITGLSLAGTPAIVVGSNGRLAWGFTNSTADWHDLIELELSNDGKQYLTEQGWQPLQYHYQSIRVKNAPDHSLQLVETHWGPTVSFADGKLYALRWVAYQPYAVNFKLLQLEHISSVNDALALAPKTGIPAQNLLVADSQGNIGWTIMGVIPDRQATPWNSPQHWTLAEPQWQRPIVTAEHPQLVNPPSGRLWTANAKVVGAERYQHLGNGGYDLGARAQQIRDALFAQSQWDEQGLHQIMLDHRALFLARWQQLLLDHLTDDKVSAMALDAYRQHVLQSSDAASPEAVGYPLVRAFRQELLRLQFAPLSAYLEQYGSRSGDLKYSMETPMWAMLQHRRSDTLPEGFNSYEALIDAAIVNSVSRLKQLASTTPASGSDDLPKYAQLNQAKIRHPLSQAVPVLGGWLNMPEQALAGDSHMPRVQHSSFGQSQRMVVAPGHEHLGMLTIPAGQSGHPLSPFYRADHGYWLNEVPLPFLPGPKKYQLRLVPAP